MQWIASLESECRTLTDAVVVVCVDDGGDADGAVSDDDTGEHEGKPGRCTEGIRGTVSCEEAQEADFRKPFCEEPCSARDRGGGGTRGGGRRFPPLFPLCRSFIGSGYRRRDARLGVATLRVFVGGVPPFNVRGKGLESCYRCSRSKSSRCSTGGH